MYSLSGAFIIKYFITSRTPTHSLDHSIYSVTTDTNESQLEDIRGYARLIETGITTLDRIKVYFCGQPEAGKTTLAHALAGRLTERAPADDALTTRTRGISVFTVKLANGAEYSFWDFAGQADYHVHHDLFMFPEGAIFVVLIDLRQTDDERQQHATYWLQYILTQCPRNVRPNVMIVATHADQADPAQFADFGMDVHVSLMLIDLMTAFGKSVNFVTSDAVLLNCQDSSSAALTRVHDEIEAARLRFTAEKPAPTPLICKQLIDALTELRRQGERVLTWGQYSAAMHSATEDAELLTLATKHLHHIGEVYMGQYGRLPGIVIIDIPWLCHDVLGRMFSPADILQAHSKEALMRFHRLAEQGPVRIDDVPVAELLLGSATMTLQLLESFELCYGFVQDGVEHYVFPSLLQTHMAPQLWMHDDAFDAHLGLRFVSNDPTRMLPPGFFQRVQVRARLDIGPQFTSNPSQFDAIWMNGTLCQAEGVQACLQLSGDGRSIYAHARGTSGELKLVRKMMQRIIRIVQVVCQNSPGLSLDVEHSSWTDLKSYRPEPYTYHQELIICGRERSRHNILSTEGRIDALQMILAFDIPGKLLLMPLLSD